jgi:hypothetical protein
LFVQVIDLTGVDVRGGRIKPTHLTVLPTVQLYGARRDGENTVRNCDRSDGLFLGPAARNLQIQTSNLNSGLAQETRKRSQS